MSFKKLAIAGGVTASLLASSAYASVIDRPFFQVLGVVVVWGGTDFDDNGGSAPVVSDFVLLTPASGSAGADLIGGAADDVYSVVTGSLTPIDSAGTAVTATATVDPVSGQTSGGVFTDNGTAGVLDAADTLTAFGIDGSTDVDGLVSNHESSFYVASNAAFDIYAHADATTVVATGDFSGTYDESNISFDMAITVSGNDGLAFGGNAQNPTGAGTGIITTIDSLDDLAASTKVFDGGQRTAASNGALAAQSVRFDSTYELDSDTGTVGIQGYDLSMGVGTLQADVTYTIFVP